MQVVWFFCYVSWYVVYFYSFLERELVKVCNNIFWWLLGCGLSVCLDMGRRFDVLDVGFIRGVCNVQIYSIILLFKDINYMFLVFG